jgi:hypothetical protein
MILLPNTDKITLVVVVVMVVRSWFQLLSYLILVSCQLTESAKLIMAA